MSTAKRKCIKESSDQLRLSCCFVYFPSLQLQVSRASKANVSLSLLQNSCARSHTHTLALSARFVLALSFSLSRESTVCRSFGLLLEIQRQCCIYTHTHAHIYNIHMNSAQKEKCKKKNSHGAPRKSSLCCTMNNCFFCLNVYVYVQLCMQLFLCDLLFFCQQKKLNIKQTE